MDDNLRDFYEYGRSCILFIQNLLNSKAQVVQTPFQIDFWIIPKSSGVVTVVDEDSEDEEDDDDDSEDCGSDDDDDDGNEDIGNILSHLENENLLHRTTKIKQKEIQRTERTMRAEYDRFVNKLRTKSKNDNAPQFKRLCMIFDRRNRDKNSDHNDDEKKEEKKR
eukprot:45107_1